MRSTTSKEDALDWWRKAIRGEASMHDGDVHAGYFKRRKWQRGPWIPCRIWMSAEVDLETGELLGDETFKAEIDGKECPVEWVWLNAWPIPLDEWQWLTAESPLLPTKPKPPKPGPFARQST